MKALIRREDIADVLDRFRSFNDGVVRSVIVRYESGGTVVDLEVAAKDRDSASGWSLVRLRLSGASSVCYKDGARASYQVLSNGLHFLLGENTVAIEFGDLIDEPESFDEVGVSPCHVIAKVAEWVASPLSL